MRILRFSAPVMLICCLIFILYWFGMCFLIHFATTYGDIDRLVRPRDMDANSCGLKTGSGDGEVERDQRGEEHDCRVDGPARGGV